MTRHIMISEATNCDRENDDIDFMRGQHSSIQKVQRHLQVSSAPVLFGFQYWTAGDASRALPLFDTFGRNNLWYS